MDAILGDHRQRLVAFEQSRRVHDQQHVFQRLSNRFSEHLRLIGFEVSIHKIQNGQPERRECREGEEGRQVLEENATEQLGNAYACLFDAAEAIGHVRCFEQLEEERKENLVEDGFPFDRR